MNSVNINDRFFKKWGALEKASTPKSAQGEKFLKENHALIEKIRSSADTLSNETSTISRVSHLSKLSKRLHRLEGRLGQETGFQESAIAGVKSSFQQFTEKVDGELLRIFAELSPLEKIRTFLTFTPEDQDLILRDAHLFGALKEAIGKANQTEAIDPFRDENLFISLCQSKSAAARKLALFCLERGASLRSETMMGESALTVVTKLGDPDMVREFIQRGADPFEISKQSKMMPFEHAKEQEVLEQYLKAKPLPSDVGTASLLLHCIFQKGVNSEFRKEALLQLSTLFRGFSENEFEACFAFTPPFAKNLKDFPGMEVLKTACRILKLPPEVKEESPLVFRDFLNTVKSSINKLQQAKLPIAPLLIQHFTPFEDLHRQSNDFYALLFDPITDTKVWAEKFKSLPKPWQYTFAGAAAKLREFDRFALAVENVKVIWETDIKTASLREKAFANLFLEKVPFTRKGELQGGLSYLSALTLPKAIENALHSSNASWKRGLKPKTIEKVEHFLNQEFIPLFRQASLWDFRNVYKQGGEDQEILDTISQLEIGGKCLVPIGFIGHGMGLLVQRTGKETVSLTIYNTGGGLNKFHHGLLGTNKYQTYLTIENVPLSHLQKIDLWKELLRLKLIDPRITDPVDDLYQFLKEELGKGGKLLPPSKDFEDYEIFQFTGSCGYQWGLACLRQQMLALDVGSKAEKLALYRHLKATIFHPYAKGEIKVMDQEIQKVAQSKIHKLSADLDLFQLCSDADRYRSTVLALEKALDACGFNVLSELLEKPDAKTALAKYQLLRTASETLANLWAQNPAALEKLSSDDKTLLNFAIRKYEHRKEIDRREGIRSIANHIVNILRSSSSTKVFDQVLSDLSEMIPDPDIQQTVLLSIIEALSYEKELLEPLFKAVESAKLAIPSSKLKDILLIGALKTPDNLKRIKDLLDAGANPCSTLTLELKRDKMMGIEIAIKNDLIEPLKLMIDSVVNKKDLGWKEVSQKMLELAFKKNHRECIKALLKAPIEKLGCIIATETHRSSSKEELIAWVLKEVPGALSDPKHFPQVLDEILNDACGELMSEKIFTLFSVQGFDQLDSTIKSVLLKYAINPSLYRFINPLVSAGAKLTEEESLQRLSSRGWGQNERNLFILLFELRGDFFEKLYKGVKPEGLEALSIEARDFLMSRAIKADDDNPVRVLLGLEKEFFTELSEGIEPQGLKDLSSKDQQSLLYRAVQFKHVTSFETLINAGVKPDRKTLWSVLCQSGNPDERELQLIEFVLKTTGSSDRDFVKNVFEDSAYGGWVDKKVADFCHKNGLSYFIDGWAKVSK